MNNGVRDEWILGNPIDVFDEHLRRKGGMSRMQNDLVGGQMRFALDVRSHIAWKYPRMWVTSCLYRFSTEIQYSYFSSGASGAMGSNCRGSL
jgi:hypothetical protein